MAGSGQFKNIPSWYQISGVALAASSGLLIGLSLVLQKQALLSTNFNQTQNTTEDTNEYAYLKSKLWWTGVSLLLLGEFFNFLAYAFAPAIIVTPLGAISVVVSAILSFMFLGEKLNFSGVCGIILCIIGSVIIVFHGPPSTQTETIDEFFYYVWQPGFIIYCLLLFGVLYWLLYKLAPLYGKTQPLIYLSITSIGGAFLTNSAQGFGSSVIYSFVHWQDDNQFLNWKLYPLGLFAAGAVVFSIKYLNKSLQYFSASVVTPINYVFFSTATLITSAVLFQGINFQTFVDGVTVVLGFLVIVIGVSLLFQYNLHLNTLAAPSSPNMTALDLNEPEMDKDPITLMIHEFPFHKPHVSENVSLPEQNQGTSSSFIVS